MWPQVEGNLTSVFLLGVPPIVAFIREVTGQVRKTSDQTLQLIKLAQVNAQPLWVCGYEVEFIHEEYECDE